jgi:hypothetical protein
MILIKILGIILFLLILPFIYGFITAKISEKKHNDFKKKLEGKSLYITTNKKDFQNLNSHIIQKLDEKIICIELNTNKVKSIYDTDKIHRFINCEKLKKFPIALKIVNQNIIYKSFYDDFKETYKIERYDVILQEKIINWYKEN